MKKYFLAFLILMSGCPIVWAAAPTKSVTYVTGTTIKAGDVNANENNIYNYLQAGVDTYADGSIYNADIASGAAISYSKLSLGSSLTSTDIVDSTIVNADISASAAIVGSKLDLSAPGAIGGTTPAAGAFSTLKVGTTSRGDILYDNGTTFVRLTPGTSGKFLKTQGAGADPTWDTVPSTSNVIYAWVGTDVNSAAPTNNAGGAGFFTQANKTPQIDTATNAFYGVETRNDSPVTILPLFPWTKVAGVNTITCNLRIWVQDTTSTVFVVNVGTANNSVTINDATPTWRTAFTVDVSGLTNGTSYNISVTAASTGGTYKESFLSGIVLTGS